MKSGKQTLDKLASIHARMNNEQYCKALELAKKHEMGLSAYLRFSLSLLSGFNDEFWEQIVAYSLAHNYDISRVIQNIVIKHTAETAARNEVYPSEAYIPTEFARDQYGCHIVGEKLYNIIFKQSVNNLMATKLITHQYEKLRIVKNTKIK